MNKILRLIDANLNRSQEGLRVCEDIARFILNDRALTGSFKSLRHGVSLLRKKIAYNKKLCLLENRSVRKDVGKKTASLEKKRKNIKDVFDANVQRVKESLRALEETSKLVDRKVSQRFKKMRFRVYELEKKSRFRLEAILHY